RPPSCSLFPYSTLFRSQVFLQFATFAHLAVDAGHIELVAVARTRLGQGHGLFGFLQQLLGAVAVFGIQGDADGGLQADLMFVELDRKSTRLNSSHVKIS